MRVRGARRMGLVLGLILAGLAAPVSAHDPHAASIEPLDAEAQATVREDGRLGNGEWRVVPPAGLAEPLLVVHQPAGARVTVATPGQAPATQTVTDAHLDAEFSRRGLVFPLHGDGPVRLRIESALYPLKVEVRESSAYMKDDMVYLRVLMLLLGMQFSVAIVGILHWFRLRRSDYLYFSLGLLLMALYVLCAYGEAYALPGLRWLGALGVAGRTAIGALAAVSAVCLMLEYSALRRFAPRLGKAIVWLCVYALLALAAWLLLPLPVDKQEALLAGRMLIMLVGISLLVGPWVAWRSGGQPVSAVFLAWAPIALFGIVRVAHVTFHWPFPSWLELGMPLAGVCSGMILSMLLANRMHDFRVQRDHAQHMAENLARHLERVRLQHDSVREHAERDALTGVLNRHGFDERMRVVLASAQAHALPVSLLFVDLDNFKRINDRHGHAVGDHCLSRAVQTMRSELRAGDYLCRYGGDEFVVGLDGSDLTQAQIVAEHLRESIERNCAEVDGRPVQLTVSVGVASAEADDTLESLLRRADHAMYEAKRAGRNLVASE